MRGKPTTADREQVARFARYLHRRAEKPDEPQFHAYAEIYGDVVYESKEADMGCTHEMVVTVINAGGPPSCLLCRGGGEAK